MPASLDEVWKHIEPHTPEFAFLHVATVFFTEGPVHWILGGEATFVASAPNILFNTRAYYDSRIGSSAEWIPIARAKEFLASALEGDIVTPHGTARIPRPKGGAELGTSHGKEFSFWREDGRWQYYYNRIQITSDYATRIFDSEILDAESRKLGAAGIWGIGDLFKSSLPGFNGGHSYTIHFDIVQPFDIQTDVSFSKDSAEICISVSERIDKSVLKILAREFQPNTIPRFPPEVQPDPIFVPLAKWERSGIRWESKVLVACSEGRSLEIRHVHRGQARAERVFHRPHGRISPIVEALPGVGESEGDAGSVAPVQSKSLGHARKKGNKMRRVDPQEAHRSLKSEVAQAGDAHGIRASVTREQLGPGKSIKLLHVLPQTFGGGGVCLPDLLAFAGFQRCECSVFPSECYARMVADEFDLQGFTQGFPVAYSDMRAADSKLMECGIQLDSPEGQGFFMGRPSRRRDGADDSHMVEDGHKALKHTEQKRAEDSEFSYVLSGLQDSDVMGWVIHYRFKRTVGRTSAIAMKLVHLREGAACQFNEFGKCRWRFIRKTGSGIVIDSFGSGPSFEAHANGKFGEGFKLLEKAVDQMAKIGTPFEDDSNESTGEDLAIGSGVKLFYAYSHSDKSLRDKLEKHLALLKRQGKISSWHDRRILAGAHWEEEIDENLESAQVILLLVSADFIASNYCYGKEMKRALEREKAGEAKVIPVILRPTDWKSAPFAKLQALPDDGKEVTSFRSHDKGLLNVAEGIRKLIEEQFE